MFLARVRFFGPEKGGRRTRPQSGYHPQIAVGEEHTSCAIVGLGEETVFEFDTEYTVGLRLLFPEQYRDRLTPGGTYNFFEGSHLVGSATLIQGTE